MTKYKPKAFEGSDLLPAIVETNEVSSYTGPTGVEDVTEDDLVLPTLALLQALSPDVTAGLEGARAGVFWHSGYKSAHEPPLRIIFLHHSVGAYLPKNDRHGREQCISRDGLEGNRYGECDLCQFNYKQWGEDRSPPICSEVRNIVVLMPDGTPARMRFSRTSMKGIKNFLSTVKLSRKPLWAHPTVISVKQAENAEGQKYFVPLLQWDTNDVLPDEFLKRGADTHKVFALTHEEGKLTDAESKSSDTLDDTVPY